MKQGSWRVRGKLVLSWLQGHSLIVYSVDGLVLGSSAFRGTDVKGNQSRAWTSFVECICAAGRALPPLIIFEAKTIQDQWFEKDFHQPGWHFARSENGWTSNAIALEWLEKVFLPETKPFDPEEARLLIVNGQGSHATDEFIWECFSNKVYLLFMPDHTSHVLQPLDLTCFFPLKNEYRRLIADLAEITDSAPVGKLKFLRCYAKARIEGLKQANIKAGFRASGLYLINKVKALNNPHVLKAAEIAAQRKAVLSLPSSPEDLNIPHTVHIPQRGSHLIEMLKGITINTAEARQVVKAAGRALDEKNVEIAALEKEVQKLKDKIEDLAPKRRRKIPVDANEKIISMEQVLANRVRLAEQYAYKQKLREIANLADSDSEDVDLGGAGAESEEEEEEEEEDEDGPEVHIASSATRAGRAIRRPARYRY